MSPDAITGCRERAEAVVNGFKQVREQQARDVLNLTAHIAEVEHARDVLLRRLEDLRNLDSLPGKQRYSDFFDSIFKDIKK
jgi:hypothetical protein